MSEYNRAINVLLSTSTAKPGLTVDIQPAPNCALNISVGILVRCVA